MSTTFELPIRKNSLVKAFEESKETRRTSSNLEISELYAKHFVTTMPPITEQPPKFDFVSLGILSIGTVLKSNTTSS